MFLANPMDHANCVSLPYVVKSFPLVKTIAVLGELHKDREITVKSVLQPLNM